MSFVALHPFQTKRMKGILFNDRFLLTDLVISGQMTQIRQIVPLEDVKSKDDFSKCLTFRVGDVLAVMQSYETIVKQRHLDADYVNTYLKQSEGWKHKDSAKEELMPNQIIIKQIRLEKLGDISNDDCLKEGIRKNRWGNFYFDSTENQDFIFCTPKQAYISRFEKMSDSTDWKTMENSLTAIYEFGLVDKRLM